ncbi:hypothetical protein SLS60_002056 [Paraconiothyrium brasiliense]|uniref:Uncharacterized protein n=1 Tax=Paraconiothyrium brasiliense TaxID=300254 RepID=A0ABR3S129_9PLEO
MQLLKVNGPTQSWSGIHGSGVRMEMKRDRAWKAQPAVKGNAKLCKKEHDGTGQAEILAPAINIQENQIQHDQGEVRPRAASKAPQIKEDLTKKVTSQLRQDQQLEEEAQEQHWPLPDEDQRAELKLATKEATQCAKELTKEPLPCHSDFSSEDGAETLRHIVSGKTEQTPQHVVPEEPGQTLQKLVLQSEEEQNNEVETIDVLQQDFTPEEPLQAPQEPATVEAGRKKRKKRGLETKRRLAKERTAAERATKEVTNEETANAEGPADGSEKDVIDEEAAKKRRNQINRPA